MANDPTTSEHHFKQGLESGRVFVDTALAGEISASDWNSVVPIGIALTMNGPSTDFILGRMYEYVSDDAYDKVVRRSPDGQLLKPEEYILDENEQAVLARHWLRRANCSVI